MVKHTAAVITKHQRGIGNHMPEKSLVRINLYKGQVGKCVNAKRYDDKTKHTPQTCFHKETPMFLYSLFPADVFEQKPEKQNRNTCCRIHSRPLDGNGKSHGNASGKKPESLLPHRFVF